jgi:ribonuclease HI
VTFSAEDLDSLRALEERLWIAAWRFDRAFMQSILAEQFCEIGASGRLYSRAETLSAIPRPIEVELPLAEWAVRELGDRVALVSYRTAELADDGSTRVSRRASVWSHGDAGWLLEFHQGTVTGS